MNKRSATLIAAALVGVLAIAGAAFSLGITGPTASAASEQMSAVDRKPIVRTLTKTVVVHRQAATPTPVIVQAAASTTSSVSGDDNEGSDHENEGPDDHGFEDHGSDDHGIDDD